MTGTFAALGVAFALIWPMVGPKLQSRHESAVRLVAADRPARAQAPAAPPLPASSAQAASSAAREAPNGPAEAMPPNAPPVIQSVSIRGGAAITAGSDVRLDVAATDADGDALELRTRWTVNGRSVETHTTALPKSQIRRGDRVAAIVVAYDGKQASEPFQMQEMAVANAIPMITTFPAGFDASGSFVYPIGAVDPDGDPELVYELVEGPPGMRFETQDATLRWSPIPGQAGRHAVRVHVRDGRGGIDRQAFELRVGPNHASPSSLAEQRVAR